MVQITLSLAQLRLIEPNLSSLDELLPEEAVSQIQALYTFLNTNVKVELQGETITIHADVTSELDKSDQKQLDKAIAEANRGRYETAVSHLQRILNQSPGHVIARRNLGMAYLEMGQREQAETTIRETLRLNPQDAWSLLLLGNIYLQHHDDLAMAERLYQAAAAANPDDPYLLSNIGSLYAKQEDAETARSYFQRSIQVDPNYPHGYFNLAVLENGAGNTAGVIATLDDLFDRPESMDIRTDPVYERAWRMYRQARIKMAEAEYDDLMAFVSERRDALEAEGGVEIELVRDESINVTARTQIAWHHNTPRHIIRYKTDNTATLPHVLAHELEHILLEHEARQADNNRFFITSNQTQEQARTAIAGDIYKLKRKMPQEVVEEYIDKLLNGFADRLYNFPLDMIIEQRLYDNFPQLRSSQFASLYQAYQDGVRSLNDPDAKQLTPRLIYNATLAMEAGYAIFSDNLWHGRSNYATAYQSTRHYRDGQALVALWQECIDSFQPGDEYDLVDQVAEKLRVSDWYAWRKDEKRPVQEVGGVTDQELLQTKEMASVMYCLSALQRFDKLSREEIRQIVNEAAMMGASGIDYTSSEQKYSLNSIPDEQFSGLQLLCLMYVGFKDIDPTVDLGIDLSQPYETALKLHNK